MIINLYNSGIQVLYSAGICIGPRLAENTRRYSEASAEAKEQVRQTIPNFGEEVSGAD